MSVLDDIYNNRYEAIPSYPNPKYATQRKELYSLWEQISDTVGAETVDRLWEMEADLQSREREDVFRAGFRLGAGLMAELL